MSEIADTEEFRVEHEHLKERVAELEDRLKKAQDGAIERGFKLLDANNRIAELEHNWQMEGNFSRTIIDARDKRIAELEESEKMLMTQLVEWRDKAQQADERIAELEEQNKQLQTFKAGIIGDLNVALRYEVRLEELEEGLSQYADQFPKPNIASELLAKGKAHADKR